MCPHWKSAVLCELCTGMRAREKCASARVQVGVVSAGSSSELCCESTLTCTATSTPAKSARLGPHDAPRGAPRLAPATIAAEPQLAVSATLLAHTLTWHRPRSAHAPSRYKSTQIQHLSKTPRSIPLIEQSPRLFHVVPQIMCPRRYYLPLAVHRFYSVSPVCVTCCLKLWNGYELTWLRKTHTPESHHNEHTEGGATSEVAFSKMLTLLCAHSCSCFLLWLSL